MKGSLSDLKEKREEINPLFNPFPGLRPFKLDESHLFFGREGQSDEVLIKLSQNKFVAIVGPSGSGKSSFTFCGVLPLLYGGYLENKSSEWQIVKSRPGAAPIENLATAINNEFDNPQENEEEKKLRKKLTETLLRSSSAGLVNVLSDESQNKNILVLIDQFEELFRFKGRINKSNIHDDSLAFINLLVEAVQDETNNIYVALTMRSDFIGDCAQFSELTYLINKSHYLIPQMTRSQLQDAIEGPVSVGEGKIDSSLVQQLLNDLGDETDQLPILQHALMRTWEYWIEHREMDEKINIRHYQAIGGMQEALSQHANEAFNELNEEEKVLCEKVFKAITEKKGEDDGVRRPTRLNEIALICDTEIGDLESVLEVFRQSGRSFITPEQDKQIDEKSIIDISHESLIRIWSRLKKWVNDEAESASLYLRLAEAATLHQQGKSGLWGTPDLQLALNWQSKQKPTLEWAERYDLAYERTMSFLEHSKSAYETEQQLKELKARKTLKRARRTALIFAGAAIISIGLGVLAFRQYIEADTQKQIAELNEVQALKNEQRAKENEQKANLARLKEAEEREKAEIAQKEAEIAKEDAIKQKNEADRQKGIAEQKQEEATIAMNLALKNEKEAIRARENEARQREIAEESERKAVNQRMVSIAKAMALKSVMEEDTDLKGLTAFQAYLFNFNHDGLKYDPDIYDGLYYASKSLKNDPYRSFSGHTDAVKAFVSSADGKYIYSTGSDGRVLQFNSNNPLTKPEMVKDSSNVVNDIILDKGGKTLICSDQTQIYFIDPQENKINKIIDISGIGQITQLEPSTMPGKFYSIGLDQTLRLWDKDKNEIIHTNDTKINVITSCPAKNWLAIGDENGKIIILDMHSNKVLFEIHNGEEKKKGIYSIAFNDTGKMMAAGDLRGVVRLWNVNAGVELVKVLTRHYARVNDIQFSKKTSQLATASWDKTVRIWNLNHLNDLPIVLKDHNDWVWSISFSHDDKYLLAGCRDNLIRVWPTNLEMMSDKFCERLNRNMTLEEWSQFVAEDIDYEITCQELPSGR